MKTRDKFWLEAAKKYKLSDIHVQMAKELGMNPKNFGKIANHKQEKWKVPLAEFIEHCYFKRFKKKQPKQTRLQTPYIINTTVC